ncbi:hypothetical protein [Coxiella endosymbiont of Ornithodoros maritimus]|uniref:hypothetical protein n=1 Tax=Coxiella endosymbiont of Ornithodoros maritimus TaxID=1656172 RepID=UPI002264C11E|nr:hypothetical protein [Coxiella endosymbiont of Ornithodoros maritimus]
MDIVELKKVNNYCWTLRASAGVSLPIQLYRSESLIREMDDKVLEQISNVVQLPGLVNAAMAMPDAHWGFDISYGIHCLRTNLVWDELKGFREAVAEKNSTIADSPLASRRGGLIKS